MDRLEFWQKFVSTANHNPDLCALHGPITRKCGNNHYQEVECQGYLYRYNAYVRKPQAAYVSIFRLPCKKEEEQLIGDWVNCGFSSFHQINSIDCQAVIDKMISAMLALSQNLRQVDSGYDRLKSMGELS